MIKTIPNRVPSILKSGHNTYKPEMKGSVKMQNLIIRTLLSDDLKNKSMKELYEIAKAKQEKDTCEYLENVFKIYDGDNE